MVLPVVLRGLSNSNYISCRSKVLSLLGGNAASNKFDIQNGLRYASSSAGSRLANVSNFIKEWLFFQLLLTLYCPVAVAKS